MLRFYTRNVKTSSLWCFKYLLPLFFPLFMFTIYYSHQWLEHFSCSPLELGANFFSVRRQRSDEKIDNKVTKQIVSSTLDTQSVPKTNFSSSIKFSFSDAIFFLCFSSLLEAFRSFLHNYSIHTRLSWILFTPICFCCSDLSLHNQKSLCSLKRNFLEKMFFLSENRFFVFRRLPLESGDSTHVRFELANVFPAMLE